MINYENVFNLKITDKLLLFSFLLSFKVYDIAEKEFSFIILFVRLLVIKKYRNLDI